MPYHHIRLFIDDYLAGTISETDKARFEEILAEDADSRQFVEEEKRLREVLTRDAYPDPGERYWDSLETSILERTGRIPSDKSPGKSATIETRETHAWRPLLALAASVVLFTASIAVTENVKPQLLYTDLATIQTITVTPDYRETLIHSVYGTVSAELDLLSAMVCSPPGVLTERLTSKIIDGRLE
ncbi:MAG: hypothetical protein JW763_09155 [candidate division Zixibacteria bacterium]|nr:hypothetical protein [candidate division Zixibacteria bacterium]